MRPGRLVAAPQLMRLKAGAINLLLLLLVLALGTLVWLPLPSGDHSRDARVTGIDPAQVRTIQIIARGKPDILLEQRNGGWFLIRPIAGPAKAKPVQALLAIATQPSLMRFPADGKSLEPFGLAESGLRLRLDQHEITFGTTDPVYFRRYVLFEGQVHLIDDRAYHHLVTGAEGLLDAPEGGNNP